MSDEIVSKADKASALALTLDRMADEAQQAFLSKGNFARMFAMGSAIGALREALSDGVMRSIMKLQGSKLGFKTDAVYDVRVVRDCLIEAIMYGVQPVGNQFNIIGGNAYITKEGYTALLANLPGLSRLKLVIAPAVVSESKTAGVSRSGEQYQKIEREAQVPVRMSWVFRGEEESEVLEFTIRVNKGMSEDALRGKAERKARKWLYEYLTGCALPDAEVEEQVPLMRDVTPSVRASEGAPALRSAVPPPAGVPHVGSAKSAPEVTPVQASAEAAPEVAPVQASAEADPEVAPVQASADELQALDRVSGMLRESGKSWAYLYRVCEAIGFRHPEGGAPRDVMAAFAAALLQDDEACRALVESGFILK